MTARTYVYAFSVCMCLCGLTAFLAPTDEPNQSSIPSYTPITKHPPDLRHRPRRAAVLPAHVAASDHEFGAVHCLCLDVHGRVSCLICAVGWSSGGWTG